MPSITLSLTTGGGPLVRVLVGASFPRQQALQAQGQSPPQLTSGTFLIDTGASNTVVDKTLINPLGLTPTGTVMVHTPTTGQSAVQFAQYDVMLIIPGAVAGEAWVIQALPITESDLSAQSIQGLIGRDVLDRAMFIYGGPSKHFSLAY